MSVSCGRYGGAVAVRFGFVVVIVTVVDAGVVVVSGLVLLLSVVVVDVVTVDGLVVAHTCVGSVGVLRV